MLDFARLPTEERMPYLGQLRHRHHGYTTSRPPEHRLADPRSDAQEMQQMFTKPPPSFEVILALVHTIPAPINSRET